MIYSYDHRGRMVTKALCSSAPLRLIKTTTCIWDDWNTNGTIVAHYDYSPFGEPLVASGELAATFTHQFSTKPYCAVTGFSEYQIRKYNPEIGRWLSRDPKWDIIPLEVDYSTIINDFTHFILGPESIVEHNLSYAFVKNHSVQKSDVIGLQSFSGSDSCERCGPTLLHR